MAIASLEERRAQKQQKLPRHFTTPGTDPFDTVTWTKRNVDIGGYKQENVEAPDFWSDTAVGIVAKLYFATVNGVRESSVRTLIDRVVRKIVKEGWEEGYFGTDTGSKYSREASEDVKIFRDELTHILLYQYAAFNTPVWLNFGVPGRKQTGSACFLMNVEDSISGPESITEWWANDAKIFKVGAGSGINLSKLRGSHEPLSTGGIASGPVAYMRPADSGAGTLKSGGAHRRAAKMVQLDIDHPDILDFINCKVREDERMKILSEHGVNLDPSTVEGEKNIAECTSRQNANNSVRISDRFMECVKENKLWETRDRIDDGITSGKRVIGNAKDILKEIAEAAWKCADPGVMFDDNINNWHTTPAQGRIHTSNPCGEVHQNDNTACNLASINLVRCLDDEQLDVDLFCHVVDVMITAMDITCSFSDLPTDKLTENTRNFRQLGLGYANLGAALMLQGMPYDSDEGRDWSASVTSLMTGRAYKRSSELADQLGAFPNYYENASAMTDIIRLHMSKTPLEKGSTPGEIWHYAATQWKYAWKSAENGYRNSQVTVLAPTGTISFMMDCDTTGCEPAYELITYKSLAGGGTIEQKLSCAQIAERKFVNCDPKNYQTAAGKNPILPEGHLKMVAALQPHISGGISKTVNLPESATVETIYNLYLAAWEQGIKAISIYRDGSKATQVLSVKKSPDDGSEKIVAQLPDSHRKRMPNERPSITHKFQIGDHEGYITAGMYEDGSLGEIFVGGLGKEGSTLRGMVEAFAISISLGLQYGVPLNVLADKFTHMRFEPEGITGNPEINPAKSIPDYLLRWLISKFGTTEDKEIFGINSKEVKENKTKALDYFEKAREMEGDKDNLPVHVLPIKRDFGAACSSCGSLLVRTGTCQTCSGCGRTTGC